MNQIGNSARTRDLIDFGGLPSFGRFVLQSTGTSNVS